MRRYPSRYRIEPPSLRYEPLAYTLVLPPRKVMSTFCWEYSLGLIACCTALYVWPGHRLAWNTSFSVAALAAEPGCSGMGGGVPAKLPGALLIRATSVFQSNVRAHSGWPLTASQNCESVGSIRSEWFRASWISRSMSDRPTSERNRNVAPAAPFRPERVVICTTPLPARAPYRDDAAAPRTTSTRSMSSELMSGS